jgi:malonyl-CoA/methylmalonyl-CoA synthetase
MSASTLSATIAARLRERAGATALFWEAERFSFAQIDRWSGEIAAGLRGRGLGAGARVAVGLRNSPELVAAVLAVLRSGAALVPLNPAYTADEAGYIVADAEAALVVTHAAQAAALRGAGCRADLLDGAGSLRAPVGDDVPAAAESPALIVYTSGTTGRPKGAVLSQGALWSNLTTVAEAWRWTEADRLLLVLPCFHLHGLGLGVLGSLLVGSTVVLRPRFVAEDVPGLLAEYACTMFFGVPTMYNRLVTLPDAVLAGADLSRMRLWVSGSAPLGPATFERFRDRFGHEILERFGMSEGGFMIAAPFAGPRRPGVVGRALPGIEVQIVDADEADRGRLVPVAGGEAGELVVRGPNLFTGYWRRAEETRRSHVAGFFRSGDLAVREADGMIRIVGRRSVDVIKSRGFKIGAVEIENCLLAHPAVAEAAVVGVPDADLGETVVAVVTPAPGCDLGAEELRAHARAHLAPHKVPARIVFRAEIPRTGPGKFKKRQLIAELADEDANEGGAARDS